ncbi:MAG: hypothetical protein B6242_01090 [Anaerolineaceae bacterium 4572_78]|nr:MAG: hypothetical protein B6242_01090 [Anaerolineaceae bacterium 4572_78]
MRQIQYWLAEHGIKGIEDSLHVYLTVYRVFQKAGLDEQAQVTLKEAHALLMEKADRVGNDAWRESFLGNVSVNREILQAWEQTDLNPQSLPLRGKKE